MSCSKFFFYYNSSGVLSATYRNCGDCTPITISLSAGVGSANLSATVVSVNTDANNTYGDCYQGSNILMYTGSVSAASVVSPGTVQPGGFVWNVPIAPWVSFVSTTSVSAVSGLPYPIS